VRSPGVRKGISSLQQPKITGQRLHRSFPFERSSVNDTEHTVEIAFSSEQPVERVFGIEILTMSKPALTCVG
jgi:hypothetical protein